MTDNQDSGVAMDKQVPPTDRPLTAGDVPLLREGDLIKGPNGKTYRLEEWGDGGFLTFIDEPYDGFLATLCTFVSRPATSAASEGDSLKWPWLGDDPRHDEIRAAWEIYANEIVDDAGKIDLTDVDTCVSIGAMKALSLSALASPPVSERERELEGFRKMAESKLNEAMRGDFADAPFPMGPNEAAAYHRTRADLLGWVLDMLPSNEPALTAQPAGEEK